MKKIMIIAGGTGGHIFPALAVASELESQGVSVSWLGTRQGMEVKLVKDQYPLHFISVSGVRKSGFLKKLTAPFKLIRATLKAYRVIKSTKIEAVLAMGGYVAVAGGLAAKLARVPLVIHEQNAKAGLANRVLAKVATTVLQGFDHAFSKKITAKTLGNPVRKNLLTLSPKENDSAQLRLLIVGGSQGARALNECVVGVLSHFPSLGALSVWHQTGEIDYPSVQAAYENIALKVTVSPFIKEMEKAYAWADLIICRAGAMTVSELAAVGVASILIPYPFAVDAHQHYNARYLSDKGAAILIEQKDLTPARLGSVLTNLVENKQQLFAMAQQAKKLAYLQATQNVVRACLAVGDKNNSEEAGNQC